jgi:hypothetical protein
MTPETFIKRWSGREGGQERANYALFLSELCAIIGVPPPEPAGATSETNDYVFERSVKEPNGDGTHSPRRIDLYKRKAFVLEAKQSRLPGGKKEVEVEGQAGLFGDLPEPKRGKRTAARSWDVLMMNARRQAENYARCLPEAHGWPPFILVCDVGHCIEVYADFSGQGKNYAQFPDRQGFRIFLEDLRDAKVRERLAAIWSDPLSLDPARRSAVVTRDIAARLAVVSKSLEQRQVPAEDVAMFFMRCLFSMFAEDVELLPQDSFRDLLRECEANPDLLQPMVGQLWEAMDSGSFAHALRTKVKKFNGEFFKTRAVLHLTREEIGELRVAASHNWREVEPAIFGTLLEQALDPVERSRLGAHYTPRAYVERLVNATVIEPLRTDWAQIVSTAERQKADGRAAEAVATVQAFHETLCRTRVLDPACGTGNFLYVALELIKRLEGEVLEALLDLGGQEALTGLEGHTVDPHQFLGLELNRRAAAIAELVLWIGHLQWHFRTSGSAPAEPILKAFRNIIPMDAVLQSDRELARDEHGKPITRRTEDGGEEEVYTHKTPRRPDWPAAEFIVGNPPFIGGKDLRARLPGGNAEALWAAHPHMNESADFVMYWWDRAAELLSRKGTVLRRFGLVTTNSISQVFQRKVLDRHMKAKHPVSLVFAIDDHPWTKATKDAAAVRIAMTVAEAGKKAGRLYNVTAEAALDSDQPRIELSERIGTINSDLTVGHNVTDAQGLRANEGLCSRGMSLHGANFIISHSETEHLGLGRRAGLENHVRPYRNGRDLTARPREVMVIDLFGLAADEVRARFPEVYQHLHGTVREERAKQFAKSPTKDAQSYLDNWWIFGKPRTELRPALKGLSRYIATVETAKHRVFQFLDAEVTPDNMLVVSASADGFHLGVMSSRLHCSWALRAGGWLGIGNDPRYSKSRCFDPFPFPDASERDRLAIRSIAEELDAHRKARQVEHPSLTLTGMYNVLERLRAGVAPADLKPDEKVIFDDGLVLILKELHDKLDEAVFRAYGWPATLSDEQIVERLVALNAERAAEEKRGIVKWLRPDYQIPRFGKPGEKAEQYEATLVAAEEKTKKPAFPADDMGQTAAVMRALAEAGGSLTPATLAASFRQGRRIEGKLTAVLDALHRLGFVARDGGGYALRRAA